MTEDVPDDGAGPRKIIHIDMDAFYASVEQRDNPDLRGKPVAVGGARERGVVAAASYEARKFGVRSAMASVTARRKCPELIFVKPRFEVYKAVSQQIREIFAEYTPLIEPLSLDEAYLDVTENLAGIASATEVAKAIRARIREVTGLTASAGVSYNKFLAKLASDYDKPDGLFVIRPEQGAGFVQDLAVGRFHGIGQATNEKMRRLGIETGADLRSKSRAFLQEHFGVSGDWYYAISRGIDHRRVRPDRERKSVGAETTFFRDIDNPEEAREGLAPLIDKVWRYCEREALNGRTVTLKVKFNDFRQITRSRTGAPVDNAEALRHAVLILLDGVFPIARSIRLLGVSLSSFDDVKEGEQQQLQLAL
ncbi:MULTISPECIES: DNA polymerase IV [Asticcacaulis]|uniref:DNA polymerase IV n=1 Tax=Asticcacaulis TaxID=76890 RepID=UPI001AE56EF9|nr:MULTISPECIES: DNA polymerase IV [Asticcacaulis]MBP2159803.1 DNA polymerase-4 [Asticcacaulis solisilvae]MDR6800848.1 DNA polymerase-4 [Asticcacaulis sp. BE141]